MRFQDVLYGVYERRLATLLTPQRVPRHVGVMLDGNRRWARQKGTDSAHGHEAGAANIVPLLTWSEEVGVEIVTLWLLSTDNLNRAAHELLPLLSIIENVIDELAATGRWRINVVGARELLPPWTAARLDAAAALTAHSTGMVVNIAVGYGGRREIADAVRAMLLEADAAGKTLAQVAASVDPQAIEAHLYTRGQPDPDLVIRTSGEQRIGGFLLWQSTHSEFYFCEAYWPDFRRVDFLRALRSFAERERRYGT